MFKELKRFINHSFFKVRYTLRKEKFKRYIKQEKELIIETDEKDRCSGKSTLMVELSNKYDTYIFVKYRKQVRHLKEKGANKIIHCCTAESIRGLRSKNIVFIDEGFSEEDLLMLKANFKVYGFHRRRDF